MSEREARETNEEGSETTWMYARGIPIEAQYLYKKALDLENQGKNEAALKYFRQAVIIAPCYVRAVCEIGNCCARMGMYDEAIRQYDRALQIDRGR